MLLEAPLVVVAVALGIMLGSTPQADSSVQLPLLPVHTFTIPVPVIIRPRAVTSVPADRRVSVL